MSASELSRPVKIRALTEEPYSIEATESERAALAKRFDLISIEGLNARIQLTPEKDAIAAKGTIAAKWIQPCAVAGDDLPMTLDDEISIRFVPVNTLTPSGDEEVELAEDDLDEMFYEGDSFDLGEAVAQTLGLAIDPYATGRNAEKIRKDKNIAAEGEQDGPLAELLSALKRD